MKARDEKGAQADSPGTRNTRARTPVAHEPCAEGQGRVLQSRVDKVALAYRAPLPREALVRLTNAAQQQRSYSLGGHLFEVREHGVRGRFCLRNSDALLMVGPDRHEFNVVVELNALFLATQGLETALGTADELAYRVLGTRALEVRPRRADFCADVAGVTFDAQDVPSFVTRARSGITFNGPDRVYTKRRKDEVSVTGFVVAPGNPILVRIYDKLEELRAVQGADSEKTRTELEAYRRAGWDGEQPVWRVECQLRTSALQQLGVKTPGDLLARGSAVWAYVLGCEGSEKAWVRLVDLGSATRRKRCATAPRWLTFQKAWGASEPAERQQGKRGGIPAEQFLGSLLSYLGSTGALGAPSPGAPVEQLLEGDFETARALVRAHIPLFAGYPKRREAARGRFASLCDSETGKAP